MKASITKRIIAVVLMLILVLSHLSSVTADETRSGADDITSSEIQSGEDTSEEQAGYDGISEPAYPEGAAREADDGSLLGPEMPDILENDTDKNAGGLLSKKKKKKDPVEENQIKTDAFTPDGVENASENEEEPVFANHDANMEAFLKSIKVEQIKAENIENEEEAAEEESPSEEESAEEESPAEEESEEEESPSEEESAQEESVSEAILEESAEGELITGTCGTSVEWKLDTTSGVLTITGEGDMDSYSASPWKSYASQVKSLVIEEGITGIGANAFASLTSLASASITDNIERIGYRAFYNCSALSTVNIPKSWNECPSNSSSGTLNTTYCGHVFEGCRALTMITVPEGVATLPAFAFNKCNYLKEISLPASLQGFGSHVFFDCSALTEIALPAKLSKIPKSLFYGCSAITEMIIPETVESIESYAFYNCSKLTALTIPSNVTEIKEYTFYGCTKLQSITISGNITALGEYSFYNCKELTAVVLPDSIEQIGYQAFYNCTSLSSINIPRNWNLCPSKAANGTMDADNCGHIFEGCKALTSITVPQGMTSLPPYAFCNCDYLKSITLPDSMGELPNHTFYECSALERVVLPQATKIIKKSLFCYCSALTEVVIPDGVTEIVAFAFYGCSSLPELSLPDSVEKIGYQAFADCTSLSSINIPMNWSDCPSNHNNGEISADYCGHIFEGCSALVEITVPEGMTSLPGYAFCKCNYLAKVNLPDSMGELPNHAFYQCSALERIVLPQTTKTIRKSIFLECSSLTEVLIPDGVTDIAAFAFANCSSMEALTLPDSIERIGYQAFCDCTSLQSINIPKNWNECPTSNTDGTVNSDGCGHIFQNCSSLENIVLPEGMINVPKYAFCYSDGIVSVQFSNTVRTIELAAFYKCSRLVNLLFSESVAEIGNYAFCECTSLRAVKYPVSLTSIGEYAFSDCTDLAALILQTGIHSIADNAFSNCSLLTNVYYSGTEDDWNSRINQSSGSSASEIFSGMTIAFNILCDYAEPDFILESSYTKPADSEYDSFYGGVTYDNGTSHYCIDLVDVTFGPRHNEKFVSLPKDSYITYGFNKAMLCPDEAVMLLTTVGIVQERGDIYVRLEDGNLQFVGTVYEDSEKHTVPLKGINGMITGIKVVGRDLDGDSPGFDIVSIALVAGESNQDANVLTKTTVTIQRGGITEDLLKNTAHFDHDSEEEATILVSADWAGHTPGTVALVQNSQVILQNPGGSFVDIVPGKVFDSTGSVFVVLLDSGQNVVERLKTGLDLSGSGDSRKSAATKTTRVSVYRNKNLSTDSEDNYTMAVEAEVRADGETYLTNSIGNARIPALQGGKAVVSQKGYITREFSAEQLKANQKVYLQKENEKGPVLSGVWLGDCDVLNTSCDLSMISSKEITLSLEADWGKSSYGSVKLVQEQKSLSFTGDTLSTVMRNTFDTSKTIYIIAVDQDNRQTKRKLKFINGSDARVKKKFNDASFTFNQKQSIKVPERLKPSFMKDTDIEIRLNGIESFVPITIEAKDGKIYAAIGIKAIRRKYSKDHDTGKVKDTIDTIKDAGLFDTSKASEYIGKFANFKETYADQITKTKGKFGVNANLSIMGFAEGTYDDEGNITWLDSGIIVNPYVKITRDLPFTIPVGPIMLPMYFETAFKADIYGRMNLLVSEEAKSFTPDGELSGKITLSGGVGVGMKNVLYASGGLEGKLKPLWRMDLDGQDYFKLTASLNAYAKAGIACFEGKLSFDPIYDKVWIEYPEESALLANAETEEKLEVAQEEIDREMREALTDTSKYKLKDLSYLEESSHFAANDRGGDAFVTNIYHESTPQICSLSNGKKLAVWLNGSSDDANGIRLAYSVMDNGNWSDPKEVYADGTMDYQPKLGAINGKAFLVWQNAAMAFDQNSDFTLDGIAGAFDIAAAVFDAENDRFVTTTIPYDHLDMMPTLAGAGNDVYAVWINNADDDWMGNNTKNAIVASRYNGSSWGTPEKLYDNLNSIGAIAADYENELKVAYSVDEDGDILSAEDLKVYENGIPVSGNAAADTPCYEGHILYWYENGNIVCAKTKYDTGSVNAAKYQILEKDGDRYMIYTLPDGLRSTLMLSCFNSETGIWSEGTALTDGEDFIGSFSADLTENGSIDILYNAREVIGDYESEEPYGEASLELLSVASHSNLGIGEIYYDEETFYAGKSMPFTVEVTNYGTSPVKGAILQICDASGNILAEREIDDMIAPGEMIKTGMEYDIDESVKGQEVDFCVSIPGMEDSNPEDNTKRISLAFERAYLENLTYGYLEDGKAVISADVVNRGYHNKDNLTVSLIRDSLDGTVVETKNVGTLGELELSEVSFELDADKGDVFYLALKEDGAEEWEDSDFINIFTGFEETPEENVPVTGIKLDKTSLEIPAGKSAVLKATVQPENATEQGVTWTSSNPKLATVDANGKITAKSMGKVTITAVANDGGKKASCSVFVQFSDVTNKKLAAYDAVYYLADKGIVAGYGSYFSPDASVTRGQVVLFLWRTAGKPKPKTTTLSFKDKSDIEAMAKDYKTAILWAVEKGITTGFTTGAKAGKFMPNDPCTRGQIVTFLWRYKGCPAPKAGYNKVFPDVPKNHSFYKAVSWAASYGITTGFSDGYFKPSQTCTRAQCVTFLYRMIK